MFKGLKRAISVGPGNGNARRHRSSSFGEDVRSASAPSCEVNYDDDAGDDQQEECDPLMYRLQHRQQFMREKQQLQNDCSDRSGGLRRCLSDRSNDRGKAISRDPFDLRDSLTSEEASRRKSEDDKSREMDDKSGGSHVDVVGWDSRRSSRRRSSDSSNFSDFDEDDENNTSGLYVDFGGVTPDAIRRRRRTEGTADAVELVDSRLRFQGPNDVHSEGGGQLDSQNDGEEMRPRFRYQPRRSSGELRKNNLSHSSMSSVTISSADMLHLGLDGGNDRSDDTSPGQGGSSPTHADLANILRTLERESSLLSLEGQPSPRSPSGKSGMSTLSSPVEKCQPPQTSGEFLEFPLPFAPPGEFDLPIDAPSTRAQQQKSQDNPFPTQQQRQREEDCPRFSQLKQQTVSELQSELSKMQFQSKGNLEKSWAETEKMRVENSELDTQLEKTRKELAIARAGLLSGGASGERRRLSLGGCSEKGSQFVLTKFAESKPAQPDRKFRRRRTIDGTGDAFSDACSVGADVGMGSWMKSSFRRVDSAKSLVNLSSLDDEFTPAQIGGPVTADKSFGNRRNILSASAASALMGNGCDIPPPPSNIDLSSDRSSDRRRRGSGLLAELRDNFKNLKTSSGGSVASADYDIGLGMDVASSDGSSEGGKEFDDNVFNALLSSSSSIPQTIGRNVGYDDDNASTASSDAKSGVFYPPPMQDSVDDSISDALSGVFYPPPPKNDEEEKSYSRRPSLAGDSTSLGCLSADVMEDFDFDPLGGAAQAEQQDNSRKNGKQKEHRGSFRRRPSFLGLFDAFDPKELDVEDVDDDDEEIATSSAMAPPRNKKKLRVAVVNASILEKDNEIERVNASIEEQEDEMQRCEDGIAEGNMCYDESDCLFKEKELELEQDVGELQEKDAETELVLAHAEESEHWAKEREHVLEEELRNREEDNTDDDINGKLLEEESDDSVDLEEQLSSCQQRYEASQEEAIKSLTALLDDLDAMHIPSLNGEHEGSISGHIVARFDQLTDKEEELVGILGDSSRLASCQASFETTQMNIETSMYWLKSKVESLECALQNSLDTINILIKREIGEDDRTHTTESSTASERLAWERSFIEAMLSRVELIKLNVGRELLDALSDCVEFLTQWDKLLHSSMSDPLPSPACDSSLEGVADAAKASASLAAVRSDILNEEAKFCAKMQQSASVLNRRSPKNRSASPFNGCNGKPSCLDDRNHQQPAAEMELSKQISHQLSNVRALLLEKGSARRTISSTVNIGEILEEDISEEACREMLDGLERQISAVSSMLSEREFIMKENSSKLASLHARMMFPLSLMFPPVRQAHAVRARPEGTRPLPFGQDP